MKSKTLGLLIAIVLVVLLAAPVGALPAPDQAVPAPNTGEPGVYIVRFEGASLASYEGGIAGLEATSPAATGEARLDAKSPASLAYLDYLAGRHDQFVAAMERTLDRSVEVLYRYDVVLNGMAVRMTGQEAAQVAALPGVVDVQLETIEQPDTVDSVPWIGAPSIWDGSAVPGGSGTYGEGVIVGILDTGINSDHPSFAATGPVDGYVHINPYGAGVYVGHCVANPGFCNDKLIGAWNYTDGPEDTNGHGSHTASTVAGNFVNAGITTPSGFVVNAQISGVAPHANVIMYDVCDAGGCGSAGSVAAINQAVLDGVDAINYSISGGNNPYSDLVELAFLDANTAGIFVSTSAGNNGPGASTVAHRSPWVSTVAASTHNRLYTTGLINMSGGSTTPPADMSGQSISTGIDNRPIVYAGNYGDPLCGTPFPGGTWTNEIVVCDRGGGIARVDKGANVLAGGADGFVLANDAASGDSLVADAHYLPAVHITYDDGVILKAWLADGGAGHTATIPATTADLSPANGDIMASFSSRGPNTTFDALKPDMTAPGVAVLAASMNGIEYEWMGGTSMSSPHNAGAGALMKALYPSWTPSEIKSAIMTTSETDNLRKEDGVTPADPFDVGAGRDDLMYAALAGIVFDETRANYEAANPATGGDPKTLNVPSLQDSNCGGTCSWTRVVSSTQSAAVTWTASGTGMGFTFSPASFSLPAGATQEIVITANVAGLPIGSWAFGEVTLTPSDSSIPEAHLPVAVIPSGDVPVISVEPAGFDTTQQVDTAVTHPLVVNNDGAAPLDWSIFEDAGVLGGAVLVDWFENFDSYATDISLHGQGGWKGWGNDSGATAYTRDEQARSTPNSVEVMTTTDLVHEYSGYTSGTWHYTAWQYIPADFAGTSYFILLNQYDDAGTTNNWSTEVVFDSSTGMLSNDGPAGGTLPIVYDEWVEIRVEIDLDNDIQRFFYDGYLLFQDTWTGGMSGAGILNIGAVDLFANGASAVYYDDLSLVETSLTCSAPDEIPWVSVDPISGTTPVDASSMVDVTFDTTGLTVGNTYGGNLCIESNDPVHPLVIVPLDLTVVADAPAISVDPASLHSTQYTDMMSTLPLTICNVGDAALSWELSEQPGTLAAALPLAGAAPRVPEDGTTGSRGGSAGTDQPIVYNSVTDFGEGFDDITLLPGLGWFFQNNSDPLGVTDWFQGNDTVFPAHAGAPTAYIGANFNNTTGVGTISNWMLTPEISLNNGDTISFWTRVPTGSSWPDRLELRLSTAGPSTNVGTAALDVGDFTTLLLSVNPTLAVGGYPDVWTQFSATLSGIPAGASGRIAFRYFVTDGGPSGSNSNYIGIDTVEYTSSPAYDVPWLSEEPIVGVVEPGLCQVVDVSFDSTGLTPADYLADLVVDSNDPTTPQVVVPVTLTVLAGEPDVVVEPLELTAEVCADAIEVVTFTVCNTGLVPLDWSLSEQPPALLALPQVAPPPAIYNPDSVVDLVGGAEPAAPPPDGMGVIWAYPEAVLWDNGPLVTHPAACSGMDASRLQTDLAMNTLGFGNQFLNGNHMADDFEVTGGDWQIDQITFFAYQTNAPVTSTITGVYYQIWDGPPNDPGSSVVWGDLTTNRLLSSANPNLQRDSGTTPCANNRYIFANVASAGASLPPGTYWLDWMTDGSLASGPWAPPITILGQTTTGNALQYTTSSGAWGPANDSGTLTQQGMPFIIEGEVFDIPWLSEDPITGTVQPGECQDVAVEFDATGMTPGDYAGALLIESNDPDTPEITIPVTMTIPEPADIVTVTYTIDDLEVTFDSTATGSEPLVYEWDFGDGVDTLVRVGHASPDAPAVDVLVDGAIVLSNVPFGAISNYLPVPAGEHLVQVVPAGAPGPAVISATLDLAPGTDYSIIAIDVLANITPLVMVDNNADPAPGNAHVKFVHASPDAPAVDIAVAGGPVLFPNVAFGEAQGPLPVPAGTYDLEVRLAGTSTVVLALPGVQFSSGVVYTVFAMGLAAGGPPPLQAVAAIYTMDPDPVYTYAEGGCYDVSLTVSNGCGEETWMEEICVCEPVYGLDFSWLPALPVVNEVISFAATASGTEPISFDWDFDDGTLGAGIDVTHVYTMAGDYVVTVMATNCDGTYAVMTHTITVAEEPVERWYFFLPIVMKNN